jgi:hypothetical protein
MGGNYQGSGTEHQSDAVYMGKTPASTPTPFIAATAARSSCGPPSSTRFSRRYHRARAAVQTGRGGLVETSGHDLNVDGSVHLGAASGKGGTWLSIRSTSTSRAPPTRRRDQEQSLQLRHCGQFQSQFGDAQRLAVRRRQRDHVSTTNAFGGTGGGDINVLDDVQGVGNSSLTLQAHRSRDQHDQSCDPTAPVKVAQRLPDLQLRQYRQRFDRADRQQHHHQRRRLIGGATSSPAPQH